MSNRHQVWLIACYAARYSVRGGVGLVFLLLSLAFGLSVAHMTLRPVELATKQVRLERPDADADEIRHQVLASLVETGQPIVSWMLSSRTSDDATAEDPDRTIDASPGSSMGNSEGDRWARFLLKERPALLSTIFLILILGWPLIVGCGAFDLYAGDISSRQLRYQLLRAERGSIYFGRILGGWLVFVAVLVVLGITISTYMMIKLPLYDVMEILSWGSYGIFAMMVLTLPYLGVCAWISAACGSSFMSLVAVSGAIGGIPVLALFAGITLGVGRYLSWLLPWGFQTSLFHPDWSRAGSAIVGCSLQAVFYGWLGYRKFTTRDL